MATGDGTHEDPRGWPMDRCIQWALEAAGQPELPVPAAEEKQMGYMPIRVQGNSWMNLPIPMGKSSSVLKAGWLSAIVDGPDPGEYEIWFQDDDSGISYAKLQIGFKDGLSQRKWVSVPDGTTQVRILHKLKQGGGLCFEIVDK
ncbi:MAG: hypothetical protein ACRDSF_00055 [Pseudonocardiaceae bacterium]